MMRAEDAEKESRRVRLRKCLWTRLATMVMLLAAVFFCCGPAVDALAEDTGTESTVTAPTIVPTEPDTMQTIGEVQYYEINTVGELYWFAGLVNGTLEGVDQNRTANALLTADIVINDVTMLNEDGTLAVEDTSTLVTWVPIGNATVWGGYQPTSQYYGSFDGQGHSISGLYYKQLEDTYAAGLFGCVSGTIKNIELKNSYIEAQGATGAICGHLCSGSIVACYNTSTIDGSGICGSIWQGTISNCYNAGIISTSSEEGGICGDFGQALTEGLTATIKYCASETGGIVGKAIGHGVTLSNAGCSEASLTSGEITYLLNGNVRADDMETAEIYWYQTLGSDEKPVLLDNTHGTVFVDIACENNKNLLLYTNVHREPHHEYSNGYLCDYCYDINPEKLSELIQNNVWQIDSAEDLYLFSDYYNNYVCYESEGATEKGTPTYDDAILLADIDLNVSMAGVDLTIVNTSGELATTEGNAVDTSAWTQWTPIGKNRTYAGTFDGNSKVITHLFINQPGNSKLALIYSGSEDTEVKNLGIRDSFICGEKNLGSIMSGKGSVSNCFSNSIVVTTSYGASAGNNSIFAAGIAPTALVSSSYFNGMIYRKNGNGSIGGVDVYAVGSNAENCFTTGKVQGYVETSYSFGLNDASWQVTKITDEQVSNGSLAHMLQQNYLGGENYWSQSTKGYPIPAAGEVIAHIYDETTQFCCCGAHKLDENIPDSFFEDEPAVDANGVYQISNAAELYWFAGLVNGDKRVCKGDVVQNREADAVLTADITVNNKVLQEDKTTVVEDTSALIPWIPIGMYDYSNNVYEEYEGTFDGQGYTISGLYIPYDTYYSVGLFGAINGGTVQQVGLTDSYFTGTYYVGGISGYGGTIKACYSTAMVVRSSSVYGGACGGLVGLLDVGSVSYSYYAGQCDYAIGRMITDTVDHCVSNKELFNTGMMSGTNSYINCIKNMATTPSVINVYGSPKTTYTIATDNLMASGELAYILNGEVSADAADATLYWYQAIGTDSVPVLRASDNGKVYAIKACPDTMKLKFSNSEGTTAHEYSDSYICDYCYAIKENADFLSEDGTTWKIGDAAGLYAFNKYMNNYSSPTAINVILTADIDLNPDMDLTLDETKKQLVNTSNLINWTPIGKDNYNPYKGSFDGQGHVIRHLYVVTASHAGLFGYCDNSTVTIKNTGLVDSYICYSGTNSAYYLGSFSGVNGTVSNCFSTAILHGHYTLSGIVGNAGTATNCYFAGQIYGRLNNATCYSIGANSNQNCYSTKEMYRNSNAWTKHTENSGSYGSVTITTDQLSSGEVAYLLNGSVSEGDLVWKQTLSGEGQQAYPAFDGEIVYYGYVSCADDAEMVYTNDSDASETKPEHIPDEDDGDCTTAVLCSICEAVTTEAKTEHTPNEDDGDCTTEVTCSVCGTVTTEAKDSHADEDLDGACDECATSIHGITLAGHNLVLGDLIAVNFYYELDAEKFAGAYVELSKQGDETPKTVLLADAKKDTTLEEGKTYYVFTYEVAAKEMEQKVTAEFYAADNTLLIRTDYSVKEYANKIQNSDGAYSDETKELAKTMIDYGAYAKQYFAEEASGTLNGTGLVEAETIRNEASGTLDIPETTEAAITYSGCSLILLSNTTLRVYFKPADNVELENVTFTCAGEPLSKGSYVKDGKTHYYADVTGITIKKLAENVMVTATVDAADYEVTLSPMYYVKDMLSKNETEESLVNLLRALYTYYKAAVNQ